MQSHIHNQPQETLTPATAASEQEQFAKNTQANPIQGQAATIWTPPFLVFCAIFSGFGLGVACLLSYMWGNGILSNTSRLFMLYAGLTFLCWLLPAVKVRTKLVRLGAACGCLGALFTILGFWLATHGVASDSYTNTQLHLVVSVALLATCICFSFRHTPIGRWDTILSWLMPLCIIAYSALYFVRHPADTPATLYIEGKLVTLCLILALVVWWLRPANWKAQPFLTFLFGIIVLLQLSAFHNNDVTSNENALFFQQIQFLCIMLIALRIYQAEKPQSQAKKVPQIALKEEAIRE